MNVPTSEKALRPRYWGCTKVEGWKVGEGGPRGQWEVQKVTTANEK